MYYVVLCVYACHRWWCSTMICSEFIAPRSIFWLFLFSLNVNVIMCWRLFVVSQEKIQRAKKSIIHSDFWCVICVIFYRFLYLFMHGILVNFCDLFRNGFVPFYRFDLKILNNFILISNCVCDTQWIITRAMDKYTDPKNCALVKNPFEK